MLRRRQGGFTISELVLVLAVFGGLIAVVVISVAGLDRQSSDRECRDQLRALKAASERFKAELTIYPEDDQKLEDAGYLQVDATPDYKVVTRTRDGKPEYIPVGDRCR